MSQVKGQAYIVPKHTWLLDIGLRAQKYFQQEAQKQKEQDDLKYTPQESKNTPQESKNTQQESKNSPQCSSPPRSVNLMLLGRDTLGFCWQLYSDRFSGCI
jgi:hypothetical protein